MIWAAPKGCLALRLPPSAAAEAGGGAQPPPAAPARSPASRSLQLPECPARPGLGSLMARAPHGTPGPVVRPVPGSGWWRRRARGRGRRGWRGPACRWAAPRWSRRTSSGWSAGCSGTSPPGPTCRRRRARPPPRPHYEPAAEGEEGGGRERRGEGPATLRPLLPPPPRAGRGARARRGAAEFGRATATSGHAPLAAGATAVPEVPPRGGGSDPPLPGDGAAVPAGWARGRPLSPKLYLVARGRL